MGRRYTPSNVTKTPRFPPFIKQLILFTSLKAVFSQCEGQKYKGPFSMDRMEEGSTARGVYPAPDISQMGTRAKQE